MFSPDFIEVGYRELTASDQLNEDASRREVIEVIKPTDYYKEGIIDVDQKSQLQVDMPMLSAQGNPPSD